MPEQELMEAPPAVEAGTAREDVPAAANAEVMPRPLIWILVAGAAVRLALWSWCWNLPLHIVDEQHYRELAVNLVEFGEYKGSQRPPLYPAFVAGVFRVFGRDNLAAVRLLQAALSLVTVVLVYWLGCAVASRSVALWVAGLCCFYPSLLGFNNLLLSEVLFTFLLTSFCLLMVRAWQEPSLLIAAAAGLALGLAALTRSVVWLFPPVLAVFLLFAWPGALWRRVVAGLTVTLAFALTIAPWSIRNTRLQETFVAIDVMGGRNFMMGNYPHTPFYRSWDAIALTGDKAWVHEVIAVYPPAERRTQGQLDKLAMRRGLEFIRENPGLTLQRCVVKFLDFWGLERELVAGAARGYFGPVPKPAVLLLGLVIFSSFALALLVGLFGLVLTPLTDRRAWWLFFLLVAFVCGMHTLVFGHSRYHLPLMPIVLVFSASAIVQGRTIWRERYSAPFWLAGGLCVLFIAGWTWLFFAVDLQLFRGALQPS